MSLTQSSFRPPSSGIFRRFFSSATSTSSGPFRRLLVRPFSLSCRHLGQPRLCQHTSRFRSRSLASWERTIGRYHEGRVRRWARWCSAFYPSFAVLSRLLSCLCCTCKPCSARGSMASLFGRITGWTADCTRNPRPKASSRTFCVCQSRQLQLATQLPLGHQPGHGKNPR
jgi:hypothetical protein